VTTDFMPSFFPTAAMPNPAQRTRLRVTAPASAAAFPPTDAAPLRRVAELAGVRPLHPLT
jgi:hypothetical protein